MNHLSRRCCGYWKNAAGWDEYRRMIAFFQPLFLWALAAVSIPIVIHLFFRRRTVHLAFSSLRFFQATAVAAQKRRRLRELLLLFLRLAIVALLALLCSRPYNPRDPFGVLADPHARIYLWVDPTVSMEYRSGSESLHNRALQLCDQLDSLLPATVKRMVWNETQGIFCAAAAREVTAAMPPVRYGANDLGAALTAYSALSERERNRSILMLLSDFQVHDSATLDTFLRAEKLPAPLVCVRMGDAEAWNYSVTSSVFSMQPTQSVRCTVSAIGRALGSADLTVVAKAMRIGSRSLSIDKNSAAAVSFDISLPPQTGGGSVRLDIEDPLTIDNCNYFAAAPERSDRFLVVAEDAAVFPLTAALQALYPGRLIVKKHTADVTADDIDSADIIILSSITTRNEALMALTFGGAWSSKLILFAAPADTVPTPCAQAVGSLFGKPGTLRLQPVSPPLHTILPDTLSALWRSFPRIEDRSATITASSMDLPGTPLCRFNNGNPLATSIVDRYGRVWILVATPLGITTANNLCETGFYVPFIDRCLRHGRTLMHHDSEPWFAGVGRPNPFRGSRTPGRVLRDDGRFYAEWSTQRMVSIDEPGIFTIQSPGEASRQIAVNSEPAETRTLYVTPEIKPRAQHMVRVVTPADFMAFAVSRLRHGAVGILWFILGAFILGEALLLAKGAFRQSNEHRRVN
jgi:hypothetical protein